MGDCFVWLVVFLGGLCRALGVRLSCWKAMCLSTCAAMDYAHARTIWIPLCTVSLVCLYELIVYTFVFFRQQIVSTCVCGSVYPFCFCVMPQGMILCTCSAHFWINNHNCIDLVCWNFDFLWFALCGDMWYCTTICFVQWVELLLQLVMLCIWIRASY